MRDWAQIPLSTGRTQATADLDRKPVCPSAGASVAANWSFAKVPVHPPGGTTNVLNRKCADCREEDPKEKKQEETHDKLSRKETAAASKAPPAVPPVVHDVLRSPGAPLDNNTRAVMEPRFGRDFSDVRIHSDAKATESARSVEAQAYTSGSHIVFAGRADNLPLLAHELAHVEQQRGATKSLPETVADAGSPQEVEADRVATQVMQPPAAF